MIRLVGSQLAASKVMYVCMYMYNIIISQIYN